MQLGTITGIWLSHCRPPKRATAARPVVDGDIWRVDAKVSGGGLFLDIGSHMLDLLDWLLGPLQDIKVRGDD